MIPKFKHPDEIQTQLSEFEEKSRKAHENLLRIASLNEREKAEMREGLHLNRVIFDLRQELQEMKFLQDLLTCFDLYGKVYLKKWERDCDSVEFTCSYEFDSNEEAWKFVQASYEDAEGPMTWDVISQEDYIQFQPEERDRVLEAFENGNAAPYHV